MKIEGMTVRIGSGTDATISEAAEGAEAVVIATEWEQFRALDLDRLRSVMARPVIVDLRNIYRAEEMKRANFRYLAVGRPAAERKA